MSVPPSEIVCGILNGRPHGTTAIVVNAGTSPKTGAHKWHFQQVHHDVWHLDAGGASVLADITYQGRPRKVLINAGKTGYLFILDRTNGKPLIGIEERPVPQSARLRTSRTQPYPIGDPFVPVCPEPLGNYERGCLFSVYGEQPVLVGPGTAGGNTWAPTTYSPKTKLLYIPANDNLCGAILGRPVTYVPGQLYTGITSWLYIRKGADHIGELQAWNLDTGKKVWSHGYGMSQLWGPVLGYVAWMSIGPPQ